MEDARVWEFEESLWTGDPDTYEALIDPECLMVLPEHDYVFTGAQAIKAVQKTPRWAEVKFSEQQVSRPQQGLIILAYKAEASRSDESYLAYCTTTIRRLEHDEWRVLQHQQTVPLKAG
ncbi:DUF4440 domain-containing protein [Blastomonas aquatica]|uniref:DUF4440 domain-containing protein n=1 Tax=Blastomonas aquatica TaxID=1510276 RepID=A0ABQ1JD37_9SPHN|nr:DUF4440 domain-containing protein [Blastomonas aquatica]GGB64246.1 hypothetical protein GCM10010833_19140 [Blastomonas aquatica]